MKTIMTAAIALIAYSLPSHAQNAKQRGSDFRLRQVGSPDSKFEEPAFFSYTRPSGADSSYQIQAALGYLSGQTKDEHLFLRNEVDGFADIEIGKNTQVGEEQDFRKVQAGWLFTPRSSIGDVLEGPVGPNSAPNAVIWSAALSYRDDEEKDKSSALLELSGAWIITRLNTRRFQFVPKGGVYFGRVLDAPEPEGKGGTSAAFAELNFAWNPHAQWQATVKARYLKEVETPDGKEQSYDFAEAGVRHLLYHPSSEGLRPSVGLFRVVGEDPRIGLPDVAYTRLAIEVLF